MSRGPREYSTACTPITSGGVDAHPAGMVARALPSRSVIGSVSTPQVAVAPREERTHMGAPILTRLSVWLLLVTVLRQECGYLECVAHGGFALPRLK